jgi:hypothetical protein
VIAFKPGKYSGGKKASSGKATAVGYGRAIAVMRCCLVQRRIVENNLGDQRNHA